MKYVFTISTNNYSGYTGDVTYYPSTGGTINIGLVTLPYNYSTDYCYGTYDIYIPETAVNCTVNNPAPPLYYYETYYYECGNSCNPGDVGNAVSLTPLRVGYFYLNTIDGYTYEILQSIPTLIYPPVDLTGQLGSPDCIQSCYGVYEFRTATSCCNGVTVVMGGVPSSFGSQVLVGGDGINGFSCYTIGSTPVSGPANIQWSQDYGFDCANCINDWPCINALQHGTLFQACNDPGTIDDFCVNTPSFCTSTILKSSNSVTCGGNAAPGYYGSVTTIRYWDGTNWTSSCFAGCGCLVADTLITLSDGSTKLVQDIQIDDELKSLDVEGIPQSSNDWYSWSSDTLNYVESTSTVIGFTSFEFDSVININDGRLIATGTHNHVVKQSGMWYIKTTLEIRVGDILLDIDNSEFEITSLVTIDELTTVYNIDVTNSNLYFANNVLTHNK